MRGRRGVEYAFSSHSSPRCRFGAQFDCHTRSVRATRRRYACSTVSIGEIVPSDMTQYTIGTEVSCHDGVCGSLSRVVVDPLARVLTHLVVDPKSRRQLGKLVPIELADTTAEGFRLRCSMKDFGALGDAEEP